MTPHLSRRALDAPASPIRRLMPFADGARDRGLHVHHLNIGQPDIATSSTMRAAYQAFSDEVVAYSPSQGTLSLRNALADYCRSNQLHGAQKPVDPDQILVTVGGSEALLFTIAAACDFGDSIVVAEPYYTNYKGFAHLLGCDVVPLTTGPEDGFDVDPARLSARLAAHPRARAFIVPSPGNPTGAVLTTERLSQIAAVCREHGVFFVVDEVYREFVYDDELAGGVAPSALALPDMGEHVVVIDSVSKRYSACGSRVGWLITRNASLYAACLKFAQTRLSPPTVDQFAAEAAVRTPMGEMRANIAAYQARRDVVVSGLNAIEGVSCPNPAGAFYLVADLPITDSNAFCRFLLEEFELDGETVMLAPAGGFYATPGAGMNQVRLAYVLDIPALKRSLRIISEGLLAFQRRGNI
ncbi:MAG: pyridoxal phosphate-dependent aminotransferase [Myxococcales bacterium]|nr:pyridoxal phosphate-dependent aminotransferase [Myxococcales bacterium]